MPKLKEVHVEGEKFFISFSFDIDDFIGDGVWWLQIYDEKKKMIYDKPFASSREEIFYQKIKEVIRDEFINKKGFPL